MSDLILTNAAIYTFDPTRPRAQAIAFVNGRVAAFDDDARALKSARTETIDLRERIVIPGLVDSHIHFTGYAMGVARVQLDGARSVEEAVARVAARAQNVKPGEWIFGMGWNQMDWRVPQFPNKNSLDAVAPNNPVVLDRKDGHSVWVNSAALRAANITRATRDPDGGVIDRDASGEPTGLLREKAQDLVSSSLGFEADYVAENDLLAAIKTAHRFGLTGIHNIEGASALRAFQNVRAQNKLTLRVLHMIPAANLENAIAVGLQSGFGDEWLRIGGVKIFADGSLGSQTAWMLEPFEGTRDQRGVSVTPKTEMERLARAAARAKLMVAIHAIGDRANRDALDVFEKLRGENLSENFRIEHVQHLHPADLPRFRALNVIAAMQPIHQTSDYQMADQLIGARGRWTYAFKSLLNAGATLAFGSDCPVETLDPLVGIHAA
ncbi:MAG: amidohydrolase, partial [Chloroflexi bacterium]|nr:amidohydrolase [Chloroflexota bacterium]